MYIPSHVLLTLHEDRIREAQAYARPRIVNAGKSVGLLSRMNQLLHIRSSQQETNDRRHAHAL